MSEPTVKAMAPIRSACGPTCTRTAEKSAPSAASIWPHTASGNGLPPPEASPSAPESIANAFPAPCRCTAPVRGTKAGAGGPDGRTPKAGIGGPGGRPAKAVAGAGAAVLVWIGGGASILGWTAASFGCPLRKNPWITLAVIVLVAPGSCTGRGRPASLPSPRQDAIEHICAAFTLLVAPNRR